MYSSSLTLALLKSIETGEPRGSIDQLIEIARYYARCVIDTTDRKPWESLERLVQCIRELSRK